jgi:hypothetical protein
LIKRQPKRLLKKFKDEIKKKKKMKLKEKKEEGNEKKEEEELHFLYEQGNSITFSNSFSYKLN